MNSVLETPYVTMELLENGILVATYKRNTLITLSMAKEIVAARFKFVGKDPRPVLVYNLGVVEIDTDAMRYVSTGDGLVGISASALIADNAATFIIYRLILAINHPEIPTRTYTNPKNAMGWLETFL